MFCLKQHSLKKNPHVSSLHLLVWMIVIQLTASGLVFDDLKSVSQWGNCSMPVRSRKSSLV